LRETIRKQDAQEKIRLGGLIVKAGLREADTAFLLGILVKASRMNKDSVEYKECISLGKREFLKSRGFNK